MTTVRLQYDMYVLCVQIYVQYLGGPVLYNDYILQLKTSYGLAVQFCVCLFRIKRDRLKSHNKKNVWHILPGFSTTKTIKQKKLEYIANIKMTRLYVIPHLAHSPGLKLPARLQTHSGQFTQPLL